MPSHGLVIGRLDGCCCKSGRGPDEPGNVESGWRLLVTKTAATTTTTTAAAMSHDCVPRLPAASTAHGMDGRKTSRSTGRRNPSSWIGPPRQRHRQLLYWVLLLILYAVRSSTVCPGCSQYSALCPVESSLALRPRLRLRLRPTRHTRGRVTCSLTLPCCNLSYRCLCDGICPRRRGGLADSALEPRYVRVVWRFTQAPARFDPRRMGRIRSNTEG
ncbi:hypothetical protein B0T22DRAFT_5214 [Podospora appendiculata]|uniref:Uncharacterized protein n=1 Tax=Podospora appendiculata TaxID=314037 RepID=A0AAE1CF05_9PEZI|nr:hypothetical protein B0T22DRAFT_5214 [Podospora appendiculata]